MKVLVSGLTVLFSVAASQAAVNQIISSGTNRPTQAPLAFPSSLNFLSQEQLVQGLREALNKGVQTADIDAYVTDRALDGLFKMVAQEEARIRRNPIARTTDLLQRVFGAVYGGAR